MLYQIDIYFLLKKKKKIDIHFCGGQLIPDVQITLEKGWA